MGISKIRVIKRDLFEADVDGQKEMKAFCLLSSFYLCFQKTFDCFLDIFTYKLRTSSAIFSS